MLGATLALLRRRRKFARDARGATAVEFALVAAPFIGLMGTIVETGLVFLSTQAMEGAVNVAGRAVMVGQIAKVSGAAAQEAKFKQILCDNVKWFIDCGDLLYDVRNYASFSAADLSTPVNGTTFNSDGLPRFQPGAGNAIVVARVYYKRKIYADYLGSNLGYLTGGYHLIIGTSVFKNEG